MVNVGGDLAKMVPGRVSTEVDARLAYDTHGIIKKVVIIRKWIGFDESANMYCFVFRLSCSRIAILVLHLMIRLIYRVNSGARFVEVIQQIRCSSGAFIVQNSFDLASKSNKNHAWKITMQ